METIVNMQAQMTQQQQNQPQAAMDTPTIHPFNITCDEEKMDMTRLGKELEKMTPLIFNNWKWKLLSTLQGQNIHATKMPELRHHERST